MADVGSNIQAQLDLGYYKFGYLVRITLPGVLDAVALTTAGRNLDYDGDTYISAATLGISQIEEALVLQANEVQLALSGITSTYISLVQQANFIGGSVKLWRIFFSEVDNSILDTPVLLWEGKITDSQLREDFLSKTASIVVTVGDYFSRFKNPIGSRTNPTEWKQQHSNDTVFDQIPNMANKEVVF